MNRAIGLCIAFCIAAGASAQVDADRGDEAIARRYLSHALKSVAEARWNDAETTLERGSDFAAASSELSYYLAIARLALGRPVGAVLEATGRALEAKRWTTRSEDDARLLEAECLIRVRAFSEALSALASCAEAADVVLLRLRALKGLGERGAFLSVLRGALSSYPRDPRFAETAFEGVDPRAAAGEERRIVELLLSRLPFLLDADPRLALSASPFVADLSERRRLVAAYRASAAADPASVPLALNLGLLSDERAVEEFFSTASLSRRSIQEVFSLLRTDSGRKRFGERLSLFSGEIAEDADSDGEREGSSILESGALISFSYDADQDGIPEWRIRFSSGLPVSARFALSMEKESDGIPVRPVSDAELDYAEIHWDRYPYVSEIRLGERLFRFGPASFSFAPVIHRLLVPTSAVQFPQTDSIAPRLTERSLYSFVSILERPGSLASGSVERIGFKSGVPFKASETLGGKTLAVTEYEAGFPFLRRLDLDLDGRFESIERYKPRSNSLLSVETDFDGDGVYEKDLFP